MGLLAEAAEAALWPGVAATQWRAPHVALTAAVATDARALQLSLPGLHATLHASAGEPLAAAVVAFSADVSALVTGANEQEAPRLLSTPALVHVRFGGVLGHLNSSSRAAVNVTLAVAYDPTAAAAEEVEAAEVGASRSPAVALWAPRDDGAGGAGGGEWQTPYLQVKRLGTPSRERVSTPVDPMREREREWSNLAASCWHPFLRLGRASAHPAGRIRTSADPRIVRREAERGVCNTSTGSH